MPDLQIPEPVRAFVDAVNRHDEAAFLDAFGAAGVVDDWGRELTGRDAIRAWSDREFIGATGVLTPEEVAMSGDEITVVGDWRSNHANGRSTSVFQTDGDGLARMTIREG